MKRKGFTLIELLTVITLLGLLSLLVIPNVSKLVNNSKEKLYSVQEKSIKDSAKNFITDYYDQISSINEFTIDLKLLKDLAYVEGDIKNPKTEKYFSDDSLITFRKSNNIYQVDLLLVDSDSIAESIKYTKHFVIIKEGRTYNGVNYKSSSNIMLFNLNGKQYNSSQYSVSSTSTDSTLNIGFQTVTYTVSLTDDGINYLYTVKRDEKSS